MHPLEGAAAAGLIATICELATDEQGGPSRMGYSMCIGGKSFHHPPPAMTTTCLAPWALALLLLPVLLLAWATETNRDRARRWRRQGLSQQRIAERLGCSRWRVRQLLA